MSLRDIKKKSRRDLHNKMRVAANYYSNAAASPRLIYVRVHSKVLLQGDLKGTNLNYAQTEELIPRIIFDRLEVLMPPKNSLVVISADEGFKIGPTEPVDGDFVTAQASRMSAAELAVCAYPEHP